jgi:hypothetical protein
MPKKFDQSIYLRQPVATKTAQKLLNTAGIMDADEYYRLSIARRRAAFTMKKATDMASLIRIREQLELAVSKGWSKEQFARWLENQGHAWHRSYSRLVFQNAVSNATNDARFAIQQRPGNILRYPALEYWATLDSNTSNFCQKHHRKWWWRHQFPRRLYPPNHHGCRSIIRMLSRKKANKYKSKGNKATIGAIPGIDPAWPGAPANSWQAALDRRVMVYERWLNSGLRGVGRVRR